MLRESDGGKGMMIDKETRENIVKLLLKRKNRLGIKQFQVLKLQYDLDWIKSHLGMIVDDLEEQGIVISK